MANAVMLCSVILLPTILAFAVVSALATSRRRRRRHPHPTPVGPPIERIAADLRRLRHLRVELLAAPPGPGRRVRTRALHAAYVDTLACACRALDLAPAASERESELSRVEEELRLAGLDFERT